MPFKFAFIGQNIPMHLPFLLVDFLYAGKEDGILAVEEKNAAMRDVLQHYAEAIVYASGRKAQVIVSGNRQEVLMGADCVVYAGDCMAALRGCCIRSVRAKWCWICAAICAPPARKRLS